MRIFQILMSRKPISGPRDAIIYAVYFEICRRKWGHKYDYLSCVNIFGLTSVIQCLIYKNIQASLFFTLYNTEFLVVYNGRFLK